MATIPDYLMPDRLAVMMDMQRIFQQRVAGTALYAGDHVTGHESNTPQRIEEFTHMLLALQDELHEALGEVGWKRWSTSHHFNTDAVKGELVDAWCFLMALMNLSGMGATELFHRYQAKMGVNHKRQDDGYDAVSTKCPLCKRAYDDTAVLCFSHNDEMSSGYCVHNDQLWPIEDFES